MPFTQAQLDAFWARYVVMKGADVIQVANANSPAYEPVFAQMLIYVRTNGLYGFADANFEGPSLLGPGDPNYRFGPGDPDYSFGRAIFNGPTKS